MENYNVSSGTQRAVGRRGLEYHDGYIFSRPTHQHLKGRICLSTSSVYALRLSHCNHGYLFIHIAQAPNSHVLL